ncbi:glycerophosphodiester phosphodiesterase [Gilvimarinus agarilyticus]|uniref:glycerophosphodiester phosphodiesterase n=1 Tax=Gilvimarinus agarilyticus TaxID=679259 RepID=UPI0005A1B1B7|nr:glycerophosphodiester phosphodiesterase [Gilvimarinus agarilyticus]
MQCIAHRGGPANDLPENSLAAITRALSSGCSAIEVDAWYLHGTLYITHDHRLKQLNGDSCALGRCSPAQLQSARLSNGEAIPTLAQVLELVGEQCVLNIEIKNSQSAKPVIQALQHWQATSGGKLDHIIISSFDHHELYYIKQHLPHLKLGVLLASNPLNYAAAADELGAYSCNTSLVTTTKALSDDIKRRGLQHWVYTANHPDEWRELTTLGVDGVFTDFIAEFLAFQKAQGS